MGFRGKVSRSTLADANEAHDGWIFADFAHVLIHLARPMYVKDAIGIDLDSTVYALDSTTIDLCWFRCEVLRGGDSGQIISVKRESGLRRESEQLADEVRLADRIFFGQPSHSPLPDHVH